MPMTNTIAAGEHGIALLAAMARNVTHADASVKAGEIQMFDTIRIDFWLSMVHDERQLQNASLYEIT
ncbi:hypothetical protein ACOSQ3_028865 [Xanthoceras sorbifolium]